MFEKGYHVKYFCPYESDDRLWFVYEAAEHCKNEFRFKMLSLERNGDTVTSAAFTDLQ